MKMGSQNRHSIHISCCAYMCTFFQLCYLLEVRGESHKFPCCSHSGESIYITHQFLVESAVLCWRLAICRWPGETALREPSGLGREAAVNCGREVPPPLQLPEAGSELTLRWKASGFLLFSCKPTPAPRPGQKFCKCEVVRWGPSVSSADSPESLKPRNHYKVPVLVLGACPKEIVQKEKQ